MSRPKRSAPLIAGLATLLLLLVLVACRDDSPTPTSDSTATPTPGPTYDVELAREALATAKARWEAEGTADYDLESLVRCLCPESNRPLKIMVRNGVIESIIDLESGRALTERDYVDTYTYHTINDRFDQIESALSDPWPVYHLRVEYHPDLGYPTTLGINRRHNLIDSGFTLERLIYEPLDSSPPQATSTLSLGMESRHARVLDLFSGGYAMSSIGPAATVEEVMEKGLRLAGASPVHVAVRGTPSSNSVRCEWRGIARTVGQREDAIRFWLDLDADDEIPDAAYVEALFTITLDTVAPNFRDTAKSNFMAIARGGLSEEYLFLSCFADYAASEYLLGTGPATLTVAYDRRGEAHSYELYLREHTSGAFGPATSTPLMSEGEYQAHLDRIVSEAESTLIGILGDRDGVVFLAPMGAHNAIAVEAWQAVAQWDVQRADDGTVHAVRYGAHEGDPEHTQTLANLKSRITAATTATSTTATSTAATTTRIASVSGLTQYYRDIGAYSDITPGDNATTTFTPAQPPPVYAPAPASLSATGSGENTANLSWSAVGGASGYHVQHRQPGEGRWTTAAESATSTTRSITELRCGRTHQFRVGAHGDGTTYNARAGLWARATTTLDACTPHPPRFEADSYSFVVVAGSPAGASVGAVSAIDANYDPVAYSITAGNGAGRFRIDAATGEITLAASLGPIAGISYELTVEAADEEHGTDSATVRVTTACPAVTGTCNHAPAFSTSTYALLVAEDAPRRSLVGRILATDADGDFVTYHITAGNTGGKFETSSGNDGGEILLWGTLDYDARSSYTLTVEARDRKAGGTARATVEISVVRAGQSLPAAPQGVSVSLTDDTFTISWNAVTGAGLYFVEHRAAGAGFWTSLSYTASTTEAFSPGACETTYEFRVQAQGDGVSRVALWGPKSDAVVSQTTGACNRPPAFSTSTYAFSVAEDAATSTVVGAVSATDPDGNSVTYSITAGNGDGAFSIDESGGSIAVAVPLDYESVSSYTLTLEARDGEAGGATTATVHITVTNVPEGTPPAPQGLVATSTHDSVTLSWEAVSGADRYRAQHRTGGASEWTSLDATATTTQAFSPEGGVACETTYELRVQARGDGEIHVVGWGQPSAPVSHTTAACNSAPPAPTNLTTSFDGGAFGITWPPVPGADLYRIQYRIGGSGDWTSLTGATSTSQTFSPEGGPVCGTTYELRVQARGDGETYPANWSAGSSSVTYNTPACNRAPAFSTSTYAFSVAEDAATSTVVGTVSATDPDEDSVTYSLTAGNGEGKFSVHSDTGQVVVANALDYESVSSYTLTVEARDGKENGTARATVHISVTNVAEGTPSAPRGLVATSTHDSVMLSWNAVSGADRYRAQHRTGGVGEWTNLDVTATTTQTFSPAACETTYEFRVQARGDGATHIVAWGEPSGVVSHTTGSCNLPPVFATSTYAFSVSEDTAAWSVVGFVLATDPNEEDFVTYHIAAGNAGGKFIASSANEGGHILVWSALDYESVSSYTLTVEARDGKENGTAQATVVITVTDVAD